MTFEHVFADLAGVPTDRLTDPQALSGLLLSAANAAGLHPAGPATVLTGPQGVAAAQPQRGLDVIIKRLGARQVRTDARRRGPVLPPPNPIRSEEAS